MVYTMNIDLNLHNYNKQDIERLFGLPSTYTSTEIIQKETELATKLTNTQAAQVFKEDIISFLKGAKDRLLSDVIIPPIQRAEIKRLLCIDSLFRPHYEGTSPSDFIYFMPDYVKNVTSLKILSVEMPGAWYLFSEESMNTTFYVKIGSTIITFTIPDGNYTVDEIYTQLNALFTEYNDLHVGTNLHAVVQPSKKLIITCDVSFTLSFLLEGTAYRNTCGTNLGFMKNEYVSQLINGSYEVYAEAMYGTNADNYVFVDIDDFQRNFLANAVVSVTTSSLGVTSYLGNTMMAKIPLYTVSNKLFNNGSDQLFKKRSYFGPVNLEKLRIRLINRYGNLFSLNHSNYSLSIEITELY